MVLILRTVLVFYVWSYSLMWKLVILIENLFQSLHGCFMETFWCTGKQKQRKGGWVCCANLVIVI